MPRPPRQCLRLCRTAQVLKKNSIQSAIFSNFDAKMQKIRAKLSFFVKISSKIVNFSIEIPKIKNFVLGYDAVKAYIAAEKDLGAAANDLKAKLKK